jgi:ferredoxin
MKIKVNREACQGHARCWSQDPDLFVIDDEGFITPGDIDVPEGRELMAKRGAKSCPERALTIVED